MTLNGSEKEYMGKYKSYIRKPCTLHLEIMENLTIIINERGNVQLITVMLPLLLQLQGDFLLKEPKSITYLLNVLCEMYEFNKSNHESRWITSIGNIPAKQNNFRRRN